MADCGGTKITDLTQNGTDKCYKLEGTSEVIEKKLPFECIGNGQDYGLEIVATYCSYSGGDNGHFWLRNSGFIHINSNSKNAYASELAQKYQHCGVSSKGQIQNYGGNAYCHEAHIYWGKATMLSRSLRKVQTIEPLNFNILETMSDYNKTEYSKK